MNEFLQNTLEKLKSKEFLTLTIVMGNDRCDLDSAVSAVVYATYLQWEYDKLRCELCENTCSLCKDDVFVPILNIRRDDFRLKPEIKFCFKDIGVDPSLLIFRSDHNLKELIYTHKTKVVLVDHHVLAKKDIFLSPYVTDVIDHGSFDENAWNFKDDTRSTIELVGSCTTLVSIRIKTLSSRAGGFGEYFNIYPESADLLHSTIILDTVNLSKELDEATPQDVKALRFLEDAMKLDDNNIDRLRQRKLNRLVEARRDVSKLTASQLLRKDVKIVGNIVVPSFPVSVFDFLSKNKFKPALDQFMNNQQCTIAVLLGMNLDKPVTKDFAMYYLESCEEDAVQLATFLETWSNPYLYLEPKALQDQDIIIENCRYYQQNNVTACRKHVVTAINEYFNVLNLRTTSLITSSASEEDLNK